MDSNLDFEALHNLAAAIDEGSQILFLLWMIINSVVGGKMKKFSSVSSAKSIALAWGHSGKLDIPHGSVHFSILISLL